MPDSPTQHLNFFSKLLENGYDLRVQVTGKSMYPTVKTGCYVVVSPRPAAVLRPGDIIFYQCRDGSFKLHRLIKTKHRKLITKGDALHAYDPPVEMDDCKGKVIRIEQPGAFRTTYQDMEKLSARCLNYLFAKYQQIKATLIFMYNGRIGRSLKRLFVSH